MITVEIRNQNRIVTLFAPLKGIIHSRNGSPFFYNSMELVCIAAGSCFGKELLQFCMDENINPRIFESIQITMENSTPQIILSHPTDFDKRKLDDIRLLAKNCPVAKMLTNGINITFVENSTPTKDLVDESKNTNCCGGGHA